MQCPNPYDVAVHQTSGIVYASCTNGGVISINGPTVSQLATSTQCLNPTGISIHPITGILYVACGGGGIISINGYTVITLASTAQCVSPRDVAVHPTTGDVFAACEGGGIISLIDKTSSSLASSSQCPNSFGVTIHPTTGVLYAACRGGSVISIKACPSGFYCPPNVLNPIPCSFGSYCGPSLQLSSSSNPNYGGSNITLTVSFNSSGIANGLRGDYYVNSDLTAFKLSRIDSTINFDWGMGFPDPSMPNDAFSVTWTGQVMPDFSESYTFYTRSDDGVRLWVNNVLLIDKWVPQGSTEWSGMIMLTAGIKYDIQLNYFDQGGAAAALLFWSSPSTSKQIIPQSNLYLPAISGSISFMDGTKALGLPVAISRASAIFCNTFELSSGLHSITAVYSGDSNYNGFSSGVLNQTTSSCPAGFYCPPNVPNPISCPISYYCPSDSRSPIACSGGYFGSTPLLTEQTCSGSCSAGYYCPAGSSSATAIICPPGYYCLSGAASPTPCTLPGDYCPAGSSVVDPPCPSTKYCRTSTSDPLLCSIPSQCPQGCYQDLCSKNIIGDSNTDKSATNTIIGSVVSGFLSILGAIIVFFLKKHFANKAKEEENRVLNNLGGKQQEWMRIVKPLIQRIFEQVRTTGLFSSRSKADLNRIMNSIQSIIGIIESKGIPLQSEFLKPSESSVINNCIVESFARKLQSSGFVRFFFADADIVKFEKHADEIADHAVEAIHRKMPYIIASSKLCHSEIELEIGGELSYSHHREHTLSATANPALIK